MPKSKSDVHETPDRVYLLIDVIWDHKKEDMFDPCPTNADFDGLAVPWEKLNYVNPPYTLLEEFVDKALLELNKGNKTVMLLPSKTDQQWFHNLSYWWEDIKWIRKRLRFKNNKWSATQPHFLVKIE